MPQPTGAYISAMRPPYPFAIEIDGKRYTGDWCLCQGGRICVRWALGSQLAELGPDKPEAVAARTLERMVRADQKQRADWRAQQEREAAQRAKPRRRRRPPDDGHPPA